MTALACCATLAAAQPEPVFHAKPRIVLEHLTVTPGETAWIGVAFEIEDGWHIYWDGINDSGMAVEVEAALPVGWSMGDIHWPAPKRYFPSDGILDHVYENSVTILVPIEVPATARPGRIERLRLSLSWLVCADLCLPESADLDARVLIGRPGESRRTSRDLPLLERSRARLPREIPPDSLHWKAGTLVLTASSAARVAFYPRRDSLEPVSIIEDGVADGGRLTVRFREGDRPVHGIMEVWPIGEGPSAVYRVFTEPPSAARPGA
ncbi:MAG TPA: protein-disulfide reductase DsbD family protein [Phycisphaerales bacterium]|nr:protein-disulfide reductase DsbD family protein [Phycisphaerales bacterium]